MGSLANIPFPLSSAPGASPQEGAGRLVNCYSEPLGDTGPAKQAWRRSAGLTAFSTTGYTGYRGAVVMPGALYVAELNRLISIGSNGAVTDVGALAGSLPVTMARNNLNPTPQLAIVTENGAFYSSGGSAPVAWPDANLPVPNSVFFPGRLFLLDDRGWQGFCIWHQFVFGQCAVVCHDSIARIGRIDSWGRLQRCSPVFQNIVVRGVERYGKRVASVSLFAPSGDRPWPFGRERDCRVSGWLSGNCSGSPTMAVFIDLRTAPASGFRRSARQI